MKAINYYIVVDKIKEAPKKIGGLEFTEEQNKDIRYLKANVISVGNLVKGVNEGDLIYLPFMKSFFEILFVEDEEPFFQLNNRPVYKLRVTRFEYSSEQMDTGVSAIDALETDKSLDQLQYQVQLEAGTGVGSLLLEGDEIGYLIREDFKIATQQPGADNLAFETDAGFGTTSTADDILDFTERNPFGEVDEGF